MSAIRPPATSPLFPTQSPAPALSPVRASRSDFFRAALDGVMAAPGAQPEAQPGAQPGATARAVPPSDAFRAPDDRPQRPGSLLDIRV